MHKYDINFLINFLNIYILSKKNFLNSKILHNPVLYAIIVQIKCVKTNNNNLPLFYNRVNETR